MSANRTPVFVESYHNGTPVAIVNADGTAKKVIVTAGANGSLVVSIAATNNDSIDHDVLLYMNDGSTDFGPIGAIKLPAGAGVTDAVAAVNLLTKTYLPWLNVDDEFVLKATYTIKAAMREAVASGHTVTVVPFVGDY